MKVFLVERDLAGISLDGLAEARDSALDKAASMRGQGSHIQYLRSIFVPEDGRCMCLFEAESETEVRRLNDETALPYFAIVPAYDLVRRRSAAWSRRWSAWRAAPRRSRPAPRRPAGRAGPDARYPGSAGAGSSEKRG